MSMRSSGRANCRECNAECQVERSSTWAIGNSPEEFAPVIRNDLAKYAKLVKAAGIQPR